MDIKPYVFFMATFALQSCQTAVERPPEAPESVFFLVRHAEKVDTSDESPLTELGKSRAKSLADLLIDAGIERIYSSDFVRTRETAAPLANELGLEVEIYDPNELEALRNVLLSSPGRYLIVGHSDTTPELVQLLGGEPGTAISDNEYDRLYVLVSSPSGGVSTIRLRFEPFRDRDQDG